MSQPFYLPRHEIQLTGSPCGHANCNFAAAAMEARRATLGGVSVSADRLRYLSGTAGTCTDSVRGNEGTTIQAAATALSRVGVHVAVFDATDGKGPSDVLAALRAGRAIIAHGDYDRVPLSLRGDREYVGLHSVMLNELSPDGLSVRVGDGLNDGRADQPSGRTAPKGWIWWPWGVVWAYMSGFPGAGLTYAVMDLRRVKARAALVNVRANATRASAVLVQIKRGKVLARGDVKLGESIGGDRRWYRVWLPGKARVGWVHASVVTLI